MMLRLAAIDSPSVFSWRTPLVRLDEEEDADTIISLLAIAEIARVDSHYAVQGYSRSPILVSIESPYATF